MDKNQMQVENRAFENAKANLDRGNFHTAIDEYTKLITSIEQKEDQSSLNSLLQSSYNNRGVAKCSIAKVNTSRDIYEEGMNDFRKSIELANEPEGFENPMLVARINLRISERELQEFGSGGKTTGFQSIDL